MTGILITVVIVGGLALLLKWRRPAWYWLTFGAVIAVVRLLLRYSSVMEACGLTVPPSRLRMMAARATRTEVPSARVPRIRRLRVTRTGIVLRLKLRPGQDVFDFAASTDRLRHSFSMQGVTCREVKASVVELRMTGYDVLKRVHMPASTKAETLRIPVSLCEDGSVHYRDYRQVPHELNIGANQSGKSVHQRKLVAELATQQVALVGIDCKKGVELYPLARRFSALADNPDDALGVLEALIARMHGIYDVIRSEQRISSDVPDAEITADIWGLPEHLRPTPVVLLVDEVAELALYAGKAEEKRRDAIITALIRLAQLGRAAGIFMEVCGQRFGSDLGDGITLLRSQLTGRVSHRVNDEGSAKMAFADIAPDAVLAAVHIPTDRPGTSVIAESSGGWALTRTPHITLRQAVNACNRNAHLTPDLPELSAYRPALDLAQLKAAPAIEPVTEAA
ncbi:plasmid transfer protein [Streptomyces bathyalis]|uniref:Plasmid transfer protein n=1 Tax=Streptomyces bathyalis TaxID=2710756 RepID=A0A7T1T8G3_9ACTN|nr:FtsK/SpoIIIE domain-containing protein [Streptomyces bathyalis]QPP08342.1 plasmid transfer protein [Streptomyces bathyalis]